MAKVVKKIIIGYGSAKSVCQFFNITDRTLRNYLQYKTNSELAVIVREYVLKNRIGFITKAYDTRPSD